MQANGNNQPMPGKTATPWDAAARVDGTLADWLVSERLMTPDIRRSFDDAVRVTVLNEGHAPLPEDVRELVADCPAEGWLREITMHAGELLLVHALCYAPEETHRRHPWLLALGDQPLGGQLARLDDVSRVSQSYCRADQLGSDIASLAGPDAWSRRSLFDLQGAALVLVEHLSAALTSRPRITDDESR